MISPSSASSLSTRSGPSSPCEPLSYLSMLSCTFSVAQPPAVRLFGATTHAIQEQVDGEGSAVFFSGTQVCTFVQFRKRAPKGRVSGRLRSLVFYCTRYSVVSSFRCVCCIPTHPWCCTWPSAQLGYTNCSCWLLAPGSWLVNPACPVHRAPEGKATVRSGGLESEGWTERATSQRLW